MFSIWIQLPEWKFYIAFQKSDPGFVAPIQMGAQGHKTIISFVCKKTTFFSVTGF